MSTTRRFFGFRSASLIAAGVFCAIVLCVGLRDSMRWGWGSGIENVRWTHVAVSARLAAYRDLAAGRLRLLSYGGGMPERRKYAELLKRRLGVQMDIVGGCTPTSAQRIQWNTYNSVMLPAIDRRFSRATFAKLLAEAQQTYEAERAQRRKTRRASPSNGV